MTVEQADKIDFVAMKDDDPFTRLAISDHLDWIDELAHLLALQNKLNAYLAFVKSGQLNQEFPESLGRLVRIEIAFLHDPPDSTKAGFLSQAQNVVEDAGLFFSWRVHPSSA